MSTAQAGNYGVAEELRDSLRSNIDMSNITTDTTRPIIITEEEEVTDDGSGVLTSGVIYINNEEQGESPFVTYTHEHEIFVITASYYYDGAGRKTQTKEYMEEIKRVVRSLNASNTRAYEYNVIMSPVRYTNNPLVQMTFRLVREYVNKYA